MKGYIDLFVRTLNPTAPSPLFPQASLGEEMHNLVFFDLVTPSWITPSGVRKSPEVRFLIEI